MQNQKQPSNSSSSSSKAAPCCCCPCHDQGGSNQQEPSSASPGLDSLQKIEGHKNLINVKSKRKRYLFKKAIELSQMCELQVVVIVRDQ